MSPAIRMALRQALVGIIHAAQGALSLLGDEGETGAEESALAKIRESNEGRTFGDDHQESNDG